MTNIRTALTAGQKGLWYLSQVDTKVSAAYNVVLALETDHALDAALLSTALDAVVAHHPALSARIVMEEFEPVAEPVAGARVPLRVVDDSVATVVQAESATPFDLQNAPLCRATLARGAGEGNSGLVVCIPHVVFDGPSADTFLAALAQTYTALLAGTAAALAPVGWDGQRQAQLEAEYLGSLDAAAHLEAAVGQLRSLPADPVLPMRAPAQSGHAFDGAGVALVLPSALGARVRAHAQANVLSPAAVYLAALQILLWQHGGRTSFGISLPVSCRDSEEAQQAVGYYTNLAVLPVQIAPSTSVAAHLESVAERLYDLLDARHLPYPDVIRAYKEAAGQPFNADALVGFNYQQPGQSRWRFGAVQARSLAVSPSFTKDRLKFEVEDTPDGVRCAFEFDRAVYSAEMIGPMLDRYVDLLGAMLDMPDAPLEALPAVNAAVRHKLLVEWNGRQVAYDTEVAVHELVERQARQRPGHVAVVAGMEQLSYAELDLRASALALRLRAAGAGPETMVGVCVARGLDTVVCLLAVLKSGAAYLPLDPALPEARLAFMLRDAGARLVLTQSALEAVLPRDEVTCVLLDIPAEPPVQPGVAAWRRHPSTSAYCIFTSGSSGTPKGVVVESRSLTEHVLNCVSLYDLTVDDRALQFASTSFDASIEQMLAPLCAGATLVVRPDRVWSPEQLVQVLREHRVSVADIPALYWHYYAGLGAPALDTTDVRLVIVGGEPVRTSGYPRLARSTRVLNAYGPTEATVTSSVGEMSPEPSGERGQYAPIGRPLDNTAVYIVDEQLRLVPPGVAGELCIAGTRLARGYLNRPELTAAHYVPDPFGVPGSRMYRTGDLGRHRPDGSVEYLGRKDQQVKVRGLRVELGEIEHCLLACPGVRDAAVAAIDDNSGNKQLVAYVVGADGAQDPGALEKQLAGELPDYMVPTAWVFLDRLPMNASGKLDRKQLPAPETRAATIADGYVAPRTELEQEVAQVWSELLKVDRVGATDNFFVLGGHSLLATQIIARLSDKLGVPLVLRTLLDDPTVAGLAAGIERLRSSPVQLAQPSAIRSRRAR